MPDVPSSLPSLPEQYRQVFALLLGMRACCSRMHDDSATSAELGALVGGADEHAALGCTTIARLSYSQARLLPSTGVNTYGAGDHHVQ